MNRIILLITTISLIGCGNSGQKAPQADNEQSAPILDIRILLDCNNTSYTQIQLADKINSFPQTPISSLLNNAIEEVWDGALSDSTIESIYDEIDRRLNFDSLFVATVGYKPSNNIQTEYAYDIFKLDLTTGILHKQSVGLSTAQQGTSNRVIGEFERLLMMKYYNLLYKQIRDNHLHKGDDYKSSKVHLLLKKNQKQWEQVNKQNEELYWECFENADGNWPAVSYPALGYYRERISFLFDCYVNYNNTTRNNFRISY